MQTLTNVQRILTAAVMIVSTRMDLTTALVQMDLCSLVTIRLALVRYFHTYNPVAISNHEMT